MKNKITTLIAMLLCAILTITGISADTAYAAEKKVPVTVTFKKKTITLTKDVNTKPKKPKVKTLKSKWGKPESSEVIYVPDFSTMKEKRSGVMYIWEKGESGIIYRTCETPKEERTGQERTYLTISAGDKNITICGIKVGMTKKKAEKILKNLGGNDGEFLESGIRITCTYENGKVSRITAELEDL